jgi:hypothetical protein
MLSLNKTLTLKRKTNRPILMGRNIFTFFPFFFRQFPQTRTNGDGLIRRLFQTKFRLNGLSFTENYKNSKFTGMKSESVKFCVKNSVKLAYAHLSIQKFFRGSTPGPHLKGKGRRGGEREGEGVEEGKEGKGEGNPHFSTQDYAHAR